MENGLCRIKEVGRKALSINWIVLELRQKFSWLCTRKAVKLGWKKIQRVRKVWKPPDEDCYKTNFDGALFEEGEVGIGVVARNHRGKVMASLSLWKNTNSSSVVTLEMLAARRAILYAQELGIGKSIFEGDSKIVITH